eukprot:4798413-Prymnesium_polylepis.2
MIARLAQAPIPLVWGFRRARRARPLPPAYVLMYHCERKVPLDRSYLRISLEHRCLGPRAQVISRSEALPPAGGSAQAAPPRKKRRKRARAGSDDDDDGRSYEEEYEGLEPSEEEGARPLIAP